jgi:hypothetical protein
MAYRAKPRLRMYRKLQSRKLEFKTVEDVEEA